MTTGNFFHKIRFKNNDLTYWQLFPNNSSYQYFKCVHYRISICPSFPNPLHIVFQQCCKAHALYFPTSKKGFATANQGF